jgi:uncharacterized protein YyaL (SSP411 family)
MSDTIGFENLLIHSNSPYLLQHAHNPVNWEPWSESAFRKAADEEKLVIVSIGYSSCHWCHVMEKECFEDIQVASLMNKYYVCIKVDREERPDIDQYYIDAANLMHGRVGWPLNAFALPDKRAVYAGTYFPKNQWLGILHELAAGYKKDKQKYISYADKLTEGMITMNALPTVEPKPDFEMSDLDKCYQAFEQQFDHVHGGRGKAPKFPMPDNNLFLLQYSYLVHNKEAQEHVFLTLDKMANGGIYDQVGGGFARYSVDAQWKVPHFEKMLYDNAQLISLYSEAWKLSPSPLYKQVVFDSFDFLQRELTSPGGAYYSALDADSEGEEGKFYVWTEKEIDRIFPENAALIKSYFGIGKEGKWEYETNILLRATDVEELAEKFKMPTKDVEDVINKAKIKLLEERAKRIRPSLDNKVLLSWNALIIKGFCDAYNAFGEEKFLKSAEKCLRFIGEEMKDGLDLLHSWREGEASIPAFLDDYALYIQCLISYYQASFIEMALQEALWFTEKVILEFSDESKLMFYFTSKSNNELNLRKIETQDNVIASPNAIMATNLYYLGNFYGRTEWIERAKKMMATVLDRTVEFAPFYSKWAMLLCNLAGEFFEVAISGEKTEEFRKEIAAHYLPDFLLAGTPNGSTEIPMLEHKYQKDNNLIYLCRQFTCQRPVNSPEDFFKQIQVKN